MNAVFAVCTGQVCIPPLILESREGGEMLRYLWYIVMWCCEGRIFLSNVVWDLIKLTKCLRFELLF